MGVVRSETWAPVPRQSRSQIPKIIVSNREKILNVNASVKTSFKISSSLPVTVRGSKTSGTYDSKYKTHSSSKNEKKA